MRLLWSVANGVPDEGEYPRDNNDDDDDERALRHLVTVYATWAYTESFLRPAALPTVDTDALARRCFSHYRGVFSVHSFRHLYREAIDQGDAAIHLKACHARADRVADEPRS